MAENSAKSKQHRHLAISGSFYWRPLGGQNLGKSSSESHLANSGNFLGPVRKAETIEKQHLGDKRQFLAIPSVFACPLMCTKSTLGEATQCPSTDASHCQIDKVHDNLQTQMRPMLAPQVHCHFCMSTLVEISCSIYCFIVFRSPGQHHVCLGVKVAPSNRALF